jgi:hypothetical protein
MESDTYSVKDMSLTGPVFLLSKVNLDIMDHTHAVKVIAVLVSQRWYA